MFSLRLNNWGMADRGTEELTRLLPIWKELRKIRFAQLWFYAQTHSIQVRVSLYLCVIKYISHFIWQITF